MSAHLAARFRRTTLNNEAERQISKVTMEAREEAPRHPNTVVLADTEKAAGVPYQIISGGHPIVGMQRYEWKPSRVLDWDR